MMTGASKLRIVGGNPALKRLPKSALASCRPSLRVVQPGDFEKQPWRRALVILEKLQARRRRV
jgi:hypothetical protein